MQNWQMIMTIMLIKSVKAFNQFQQIEVLWSLKIMYVPEGQTESTELIDMHKL